MPKINLFYDFQGVETKNVLYLKGIVNVPDDVASRLVKDGRAEYVKPDHVLDSEPQFENVYYGSQPEPELRQDDVKYEAKKKRGRK